MSLKDMYEKLLDSLSTWASTISIKMKLIYFILCLILLTIFFIGIKNLSDSKIVKAEREKALVLSFSNGVSNKQIASKAFLKYYEERYVEELKTLLAGDKKLIKNLIVNSPASFKEKIKKIEKFNEQYNDFLTQLIEIGQEKKSFESKMVKAFEKSDKAISTIIGAIDEKEADLGLEGLTLGELEIQFQNVARDGLILFLNLRQYQFEYLNLGKESAKEEFEKASSKASNRVSVITAFGKNLDDEAYVTESSNYREGIDEYILTAKSTFEVAKKENNVVVSLDSTVNEILLIVKDLEEHSNDEISNAIQGSVITLIIVSSLALLLIFLFSSVMIHAITAPVTVLIGDMEKVGNGDLSIDIDTSGKDEISLIKQKLKETVNHLRETVGSILKSADILTTSSEELKITSIQLSSDTDEMNTQANAAAKTAEAGNNNIQQISTSTNDINVSVSGVSAAISEMSSSLNEVAKNCQTELTIANDANGKAIKTHDQMEELDHSSKEIGKVIETINDIADQTNLLALNATIEAASAGDAGKGFAVVASEVKELAKQTASATEEISNKIQLMQKNSKDAVNSIEDISKVIQEVTDISHGIANAVEEQSATINEISNNVAGANSASESAARNVAESSESLSQMTVSIQSMSEKAATTSEQVSVVKDKSEQLASISEELKTLVSKFKI